MRKKIISIILLVAMVLTMTAGCGKKEDKKDYFVFYVNNELTKVVAKKITLQHTSSGKAQVKELLKDLQTQPEDATLRRTIPRKVKVTYWLSCNSVFAIAALVRISSVGFIS